MIGLIAVGVLMIVELILSVRWNAFYFNVGVPIFWRRIDRPSGLADVDLEQLPKRSTSAAGPQFKFHRLGPELIAFREESFGGGGLNYTPIMRGVIRHRREESSVVVLGLMKWWAIALVALFVGFLGKRSMDIAPYIAAVFGILYLIQSVRFSRVAKALR